MNFSSSEEQTMVRDLARAILSAESSAERLRAAETSAEGFDRPLWSKLADTQLLGLCVPEALGGMGFGFAELCVLLEEVGRTVAPVPVLPALVLGGLPIARFGSEAQQRRWLVPLAGGELVLSAALVDADSAEPGRPATRARADGEGWRLDGRKRLVPAAAVAARILVPASLGDSDVGLFLVDPHGEGATLTPQQMSSGETPCDLELRGVRVGGEDRLVGGEPADDAARWLHLHAQVALCAIQVGVCERALEITAGHLRERHQFGAPIGALQAVQQRAADCFIDLAAMRWTTWRAATRLAAGLPAAREAAVAKFWAAEAGARITDAAQHLHGGLGVDLDYPVHRYFLWSRSLGLALGGALPQLAWLGRDLARGLPQEMP